MDFVDVDSLHSCQQMQMEDLETSRVVADVQCLGSLGESLCHRRAQREKTDVKYASNMKKIEGNGGSTDALDVFECWLSLVDLSR